jgi:hypothetical protein
MAPTGRRHDEPAPWRADPRVLAWWLAVGAGAGALAGLVVGGAGGRVLMLILRVQSPDASGVTSDAGFTIDRITLAGSLTLAVVTALAGALAGGGYALLRAGLPRPARVPLAAALAGVLGGSAFLDPEGIDLRILEPLWLAVSGFIVLPALAGMLTAILVESLGRRAPRSRHPRPAHRAVVAAQTVVTGLALLVVTAGGTALVREVDRIL